MGDFAPTGSSTLAHSASTPSFHSLSTPSSSSISFSPLTRPSPATSSPQRAHTPPPLGSPGGGRGGSAPPSGHKSSPGTGGEGSASSVSTYQDLSGTTYFFPSSDIGVGGFPPGGGHHAPPAPATLVLPPYHVLPSTPAHVHHLRTPTHAPHFFVGDDLRHDILERQAIALAHVDPEQYPGESLYFYLLN